MRHPHARRPSRFRQVRRPVSRLVKDPVVPSDHAAFKDFLPHMLGVESRYGAAMEPSDCGAFSNIGRIAADRPRSSPDYGAKSCTFGDSPGDHYFVSVGLALGPVLIELFLIDAFHVDNWIGLRRATHDNCN